jgi:hypothetical protein
MPCHHHCNAVQEPFTSCESRTATQRGTAWLAASSKLHGQAASPRITGVLTATDPHLPLDDIPGIDTLAHGSKAALHPHASRWLLAACIATGWCTEHRHPGDSPCFWQKGTTYYGAVRQPPRIYAHHSQGATCAREESKVASAGCCLHSKNPTACFHAS